ncbi:hypothetical protein QAD02_000809 [Eretmocerus hayati]|uniref:Uncharacterized protein n=1 Tax=Eretmocerus hayati TaxID=131215 RepID=A0ACC2NEB0_9HYME|nr:hypothetical protein QAD02_000809 [Eretmocerus hayati]
MDSTIRAVCGFGLLRGILIRNIFRLLVCRPSTLMNGARSLFRPPRAKGMPLMQTCSKPKEETRGREERGNHQRIGPDPRNLIPYAFAPEEACAAKARLKMYKRIYSRAEGARGMRGELKV